MKYASAALAATSWHDWGASTVTSQGYNLASDGTCQLAAAGDIAGGNADLEPLAVNEPGTTATHALGPDSQARDAIPPGTNGCGTTVTTDQRGVARPQGASCDIGAFEEVVPLYVANPGPQASAEGAPVSLAVVATDIDGHTLAYSATGLPAGLTLDPATGVITGVVSYAAAGTYAVTVSVSDAEHAASTTFGWTRRRAWPGTRRPKRRRATRRPKPFCTTSTASPGRWPEEDE